jgi:hypothetical protein
MAAQQALVTALAKLASMTGDRLRLDQATVVDPLANALPQAKQPALARQRRAHQWARGPATRGCPAVGTEGSAHRTPRRWGLPGKVWVRTTPPTPG